MSIFVINDTRVDRHHGCYAVMGAIQSLLEKHGLGPIRYWPAHVDWRGHSGFDAALGAARLVVINGEGTIHHDRPAGRLLLEVGARARAAGVPAALINTGWEANGPEFVAMLRNFDLLAARDSRSANLMRAGGASVRVVPDLSLSYAQQQSLPKSSRVRSGIGFTDNVDRLQSLALEQMRCNVSGKTVSICYGDPGIVGWASYLRSGISLSQDLRHPVRLSALLRLRHRLWREASVATKSFLEQILGLELLVSGRFHACTLALAMGTPVVAQASNTGKISGLLHDAGLESWRGALQDNHAAVENVERCRWTEQERQNLSSYLEFTSSSADGLFSDLAQLVAR